MFLRVNLPGFGVLAPITKQGVLLNTQGTEHRVWPNRHDFQCSAADGAGGRSLYRLAFEGGNPRLQFRDAPRKSKQCFPAGDGLKELEHV